MGDKAPEAGGQRKGDKPKGQVKEKEDRVRERERKKDQEILEKTLEISKKDFS